KSTPAPRPAPQAASGRRGGQPSLRVVLTQLLQKSRRPLTGTELAEQAQAAGYQTQSKDFPAVVWAILVKMDNVENVPGKGYRLNKRFPRAVHSRTSGTVPRVPGAEPCPLGQDRARMPRRGTETTSCQK